MPPPGISNHNLATPAQRLAYRKVQAELQARRLCDPRPNSPIARILARLNEVTPRSPWTIDAQGCLTRTIGE